MNKTFHYNFSLRAKLCICIFIVLSLYTFWDQHAIAGTIYALVVVFTINYCISGIYVLKKINGISVLEIQHGRFYKTKTIPLMSIVSIERHKELWNLVSSVVITYNNNKTIALQPTDIDHFIEALEAFKNNETTKNKL